MAHPLSALDLKYQMQLVVQPVIRRRGGAQQCDWCHPVDSVLTEATPSNLLSYLEPHMAPSCALPSARCLMHWDIRGAVMIQLSGLGAGCCWKRVLVPCSARACLALNPWHIPRATGARLALECVSSGDGPAESRIKDERVFLVREDFCSLFPLKPQALRYSSAVLWGKVKNQHICL